MSGLPFVPGSVAWTRNEVAVLPELTVVITVPEASVVSLGLLTVTRLVLGVKVTALPASGLPKMSTTLKVRVAVSVRPLPPCPLITIDWAAGGALTNCTEAAAGGAMFSVVLADFDTLLAETVMMSLWPQPLSRYTVWTVPLTVGAVAASVALPAATHAE